MNPSLYDEIGDFYLDFLKAKLEKPTSHFSMTVATIMEMLGDVAGKRVCDLACGEGHLSRLLVRGGANVTAVDLSAHLLERGREQSAELAIEYVLDDAQRLAKVSDEAFDIVVCNMALMDIPDMPATFQSVARILKRQGTFIFSVLHPCFETPFSAPDGLVEVDAQGNFVACRVQRYAEEGHWNSGGAGIRGRVGAYHRKLSTYVNELLQAGFQLRQLAEPTLPPKEHDDLEGQWNSQVARVLIVESVKI